MRASSTAVIGGSGLAKLAGLEIVEREIIRTPYGEPSSPLVSGKLNGQPVCFLARHGHGHTIPPHKVNYRANIWALENRGIRNIIAVGAVGAINPDLADGDLVIPDQLIDYTYDRQHTFFDGDSGPVKHIDFTLPYSPKLRQALIDCAGKNGIDVVDGATYAVAQGPRLETAAEIRKFGNDGADIVGMTSMPEAALAREKDIRYALVTMVVNPAAGLESSQIKLEKVFETLAQHQPAVIDLISRALPALNRLTC